MAYTQLSPSALPGRRYGFQGSGPHTGGPFTELSVLALPGMRHSFTAKKPSIGVGYARLKPYKRPIYLKWEVDEDEEILELIPILTAWMDLQDKQ